MTDAIIETMARAYFLTSLHPDDHHKFEELKDMWPEDWDEALKAGKDTYRALIEGGYVVVPREPEKATIDKMVRKALNVSLGGYYTCPNYMRDQYAIAVSTFLEGQAGPALHASDCATHNEPYKPNGPCDCGASQGTPKSAAPKVGDIRESGGKIWRCYEVELEGAKFELIGEMANEHPTDHQGDGT